MTPAAGVLREPTISPIDYRDAIRAGAPLAQTAGLTLDFVTKVVFAPLAFFLVVDRDGNYRLATVKADSILTPEPGGLAAEYLECISGHDPILDMASSRGRTKLLSREDLASDPDFSSGALETDFLGGNDFGPLVALYMRGQDTGRHCLLILIRTSEESDFSAREKGFLHQAAPFLVQSYRCASDLGGNDEPVTGSNAPLTTRESEIARLAARGQRNEEIAANLHIAGGTVKCHIRNIYAKLGVDSRVRLAMVLED